MVITINFLLFVFFAVPIASFAFQPKLQFHSHYLHTISKINLNDKRMTMFNNDNRLKEGIDKNGGKFFSNLNSNLDNTVPVQIGDDSAKFSLSEQKLSSWSSFSAAVATILTFLYFIWIDGRGPQLGDAFKNASESLASGDSTLAITYMLGFFAVCHSGLASLRPKAEEIIGARGWRVVFALVSLPLAFSSIVYFINHRYDGIQFWDLRLQPGMHDFVFWTSLVSFFFLYPSTFNLLEVAAIDKPQLHLWETGIIRITRHPQMVGQLLWCFAHTAYMGTSFTCATSAILCLHHLFAVWNGDRRLRDKFGEKADLAFAQTSIVPFKAILEGRQTLPDDFYKEFLRLPYVTILVGTLIAYQAHPFMQAGATLLKW